MVAAALPVLWKGSSAVGKVNIEGSVRLPADIVDVELQFHSRSALRTGQTAMPPENTCGSTKVAAVLATKAPLANSVPVRWNVVFDSDKPARCSRGVCHRCYGTVYSRLTLNPAVVSPR